MTTTKFNINEMFKGLDLNQERKHILQEALKELKVPKGTILLRTNDTVFSQYYVVQGCLRAFYIDDSGKEHTLQFAIKDWWISDYTAFFNQSKAIMNIEVLQDSILYEMSHEQREILFAKLPETESFFRKKMERAFASFQKRILANLSKSAKERYLSFIKLYPNIEQSVKNYHLASYLGITTESLSRIRKAL